MELAFAASAFERERGNFPYLPVVNMFAEETANERISLISRPGLVPAGFFTDQDPVGVLFKRDGVLDGSLFRICGRTFWKNSFVVGVIDGSDYSSMAGYENYLFMTNGRGLWGFDGSNLMQLDFPDGADVQKVVTGASRLIALRRDTQVFYWSDPLSDEIDDLSFASAEFSPDKIKDLLFVGDTLVLFGSETVEFWATVPDDPELPFQPIQGRTYEIGIKQLGAATKVGSTFAWVTDRNQVCIQSPENIISIPGIEEKIALSTNVELWKFFIDGTEFLALRLDDETWVYNTRAKSWSIFETYEENGWEPRCWDAGYFGSSKFGVVYQWGNTHSDNLSPLERRFRAYGNFPEAGTVVNNIIVRCNPGNTPYLISPYDDPRIEMRTSKNLGVTWSNWRDKSLGKQGEYRQSIKWNGCGMFAQPGIMVEVRVADPVPFRASAVFANEPNGGL